MKLTIILTTIGAAAGFAYASVLGCDSVCSIASSSLNTTVYGAFAGLVLAFPINKKLRKSKYYLFLSIQVPHSWGFLFLG